MTLPMEETKTWRLRLKIMEVCASVTPGSRRSSSSTAVSSASCSSTLTENGSIWQGETQVASCFSSGASVTSCFLARALERAMSTASAAADSTPARVRSSVAAKPQQPSASTRIPMPTDSSLETWPGLPFLVPSFAVAAFHHADVGVGDAGAQGRIERFKR